MFLGLWIGKSRSSAKCAIFELVMDVHFGLKRFESPNWAFGSKKDVQYWAHEKYTPIDTPLTFKGASFGQPKT